MPSIIEGYTYDIFISYRQKDNKYDGWVTEFVDNLKKELEATFKEEISVYFDINPHDGLLETHDVDASLKEKLKCLVFIPIISHTYCDPKSFAWEHEFKAFVETASNDKFGLKVKLLNGNVASRVLPVRIHDLDAADIKECESILGGVLRSVEFIYKEPGVNKPLTSDDDEKKNSNNTKYRIQINKVANAIKEIIAALKRQSQQSEEVSKQDFEKKSEHKRNFRAKIITGSATVLVLIVLGCFFIPKFLKSKEQIEKSIAVLPFINESPVDSNKYFINGIMEEILNNLQTIKDFRVLSRTSTDQYQGPDKPKIPEIAKELGVNYIVEGSGQKYGNTFRLRVQLIKAKGKETHLWGKSFELEIMEITDLFKMQSQISQAIASELKAVITPEEKQLLEKRPTENLEAYELYMQGRYFWNKRGAANLKLSNVYFEKTLGKDPNYALAYSGLADVYYALTVNNHYKPISEGLEKAGELALKAIGLDKNIAEPHVTLGNVFWNEMKWEEARKEILMAIKINPNYAEAYYSYAQLLDILRQNNEARIQIDRAIKLNPFQWNYHIWSGNFYYNEGNFNEAIIEWFKGHELAPEFNINHHCFRAYLRLGDNLKALKSIQNYFGWDVKNDTLLSKRMKILQETYDSSGIEGILNKWIESSPNSYYDNAEKYAILGKKAQALDCLEKAFENPPLQFFRINNNYDFSSLHYEPRFQAIIKKMGLSDYQVPN